MNQAEDERRRSSPHILKPIELEDMGKILDLVKLSYPENKQAAVISSLTFHADCLKVKIDDGRKFFKWQEDGEILGVCGIQRRPEDPEGVCWGSWFFIDPSRRHTMIPYRMGVDFLSIAREEGYVRMYVETTLNNPKYYNIASSLQQFGFLEVSRISDFHEPGVDSVIYALGLSSWQPLLKNRS